MHERGFEIPRGVVFARDEGFVRRQNVRDAGQTEHTHLSAHRTPRIDVPHAVAVYEHVRLDRTIGAVACAVVVCDAQQFALRDRAGQDLHLVLHLFVIAPVGFVDGKAFVAVCLSAARGLAHRNEFGFEFGGGLFKRERVQRALEQLEFFRVEILGVQFEIFSDHDAAAAPLFADDGNVRITEHVHIAVDGAFGNFQFLRQFSRGHFGTVKQVDQHRKNIGYHILIISFDMRNVNPISAQAVDIRAQKNYTVTMYYSIRGKVVYYREGQLVVECGGVAYDIHVSNYTLSKLGKQGEEATVYTYLQVQQDAVRLFGFYSKEEKAMFEKLITISGVGPKVAMQILSGVDLSTLAISIVGGDVRALAKIKGIGKKTAERIILELREKIETDVDGAQEWMRVVSEAPGTDGVSQDAVMALASLGINRTEATKAVAAAREKTDKLEQIITLALRSLDR